MKKAKAEKPQKTENPEVTLYSLQGKAVGSVDVPEAFRGPVNRSVLWQAVRMYLANRRQGTADTKRRGEVSGGGKKPWRQKHTGRARAGSTRSPLWRKGGIVFGPHPRDHRYELPEQIRREALVNSLRAKVGSGEVAVVETLEGLGEKTKALAGLLEKMDACGGALVVVDAPSAILARISRNIPKVIVRPAAELNCYEVLRSGKVVLTGAAWKQVEKLS
ncbi:MAG: 50S ribosomal protein L4 [Candidatus Omnitrophica bacterium]|nr:50S ribosomal protein L4 [Candidatus Omnitrophota bacterium]